MTRRFGQRPNRSRRTKKQRTQFFTDESRRVRPVVQVHPTTFGASFPNRNNPHTQLHQGITEKEFMFGDFDKDKVPNIDDPRPLDPSISRPKLTADYLDEAQYVGGEVRLSHELQSLKAHNDAFIELLQDFRKRYPDAKIRIKTVPSTIGKLRTRYVRQVGDIAGARVVVKDEGELNRVVADIKKKEDTLSEFEDDFYKNPKDGIYYAHHLSVKDKLGRRMEVQIVTERQAELHRRMHEAYKRGMTLEERARFKQEAEKVKEMDR